MAVRLLLLIRAGKQERNIEVKDVNMSGKGSSPRPYSVDQTTFASNWDRIFGNDSIAVTQEEDEAWLDLERQQMNNQVAQKPTGSCGCGRSPTGNCCGWHALSEEQYQERKELYETGKADLQGKEIK